MRRRRTQVLVVLVVLVLAGGGFGIWEWTRPSSSTSARTLDYTVSSQTVQQTVSASGTLAPAKEADLSFAVSGQINAVRVKVGQAVKAGQVLATVDGSTLKAQNDAAQAQLSAAQTAYSSDAAASASTAQLASDSAQIQSASASATQASQNLADAALKSTISGTVAAVNVAVGDQASSSSGSGAGGNGSNASNASSSSSSSSTAQIVVIQPGTFVVNTSVGGSDIASVKTGMQAQLTVTGSSSTIFGTVSSVSMVASTSTSGTQATFPVTITVTGAQKNLYAGTSVTASIITKQISNVLAVPALALSTSNGKTTVDKLVNGKPVRTAVTVGQTYGAQTQITAGLKSGDQIQMSLGFNRVPTSGTGSGRTRTGGTGGFLGGGGLTGGGGFTGGFPGGAP